MISPWLIYLITIVDAMSAFFMAIGAISLFISFLMFIIPLIESMTITRSTAIWRVLMFIIGFTFVLLSCLTPSGKGIAAIIVVPAVLNNEKIQEMGEETLGLATEWIKELKPTNTSTKLEETK